MADEKTEAEKPLEKMTVKELREIGKTIPEITGVHGMHKPDLLAAIKKARGIVDAPKKRIAAGVGELKGRIKALKIQRRDALAAKDRTLATRYRRQIARLKKKTRQVV